MRFLADGPRIPDELLVARDAGDVIFFCGSGVSRAFANLPDFPTLARAVTTGLGAAQKSPVRRVIKKAEELGSVDGVGGLLATDRIFSLLEREFEVADVRTEVAQAIKPPTGHRLDAHRTLIDLATSPGGVTRLVTTNFDLLFEDCDSALSASGPPHLPDPRNDREFRGIVHLHGRVTPDYRRPADDEFVISSADFGRAYLSDGWATRFIQALLARYHIVFVGYSADDPPVQYLLEALNLGEGSQGKLYAFQAGDEDTARALWGHRGVQAISYGTDHGSLWGTLAGWAERARDVDGWYDRLIAQAADGPANLDPHIRGQIAHIASTNEGAKRIASSAQTLDASWLLVFDPQQRYAHPSLLDPFEVDNGRADPFTVVGLDNDAPPEPAQTPNHFQRREVPKDAWDVLKPSRADTGVPAGEASGELRGRASNQAAELSPRLTRLAHWFFRVSHQPIALWWAAQQSNIHPVIKDQIDRALRNDTEGRFSPDVRRGWRQLFAAWDTRAFGSWDAVRNDPDVDRYNLEAQAAREGWSERLVREYAGLYRPRSTAQPAREGHPLHWGQHPPTKIVWADVEYPHPHEPLHVPDELVAYAVAQFKANLELAVTLEAEATGHSHLHFETTRSPDGGPPLPVDSYGLTGPILHLQQFMGRLAALDPEAARAEVRRWPVNDDQIFARLRIWAAGHEWIPPAEAAEIFLSLSDLAFWGSLHERDLLYALRDRWSALDTADKTRIETRLRTTTYPWSEDTRGGKDHAAAFERINRLHWLSSNGVEFSFDVAAEIEDLTALVPEWRPEHGNAAADSHAPRVYRVEIDPNAESILTVPIGEIIPTAEQAEMIEFQQRVHRVPFRGLAKDHPKRALAALTHAARRGEAPVQPWTDFLNSEARTGDGTRLLRVIIGRLMGLPDAALAEIIYPVSDWMKSVARRLFHEVPDQFPALWDRVIATLTAHPNNDLPQPNMSWADKALNAPVGKLSSMLLEDPAKNGLELGQGFPSGWKARVEQLLALPGQQRCQAIVMFGFQLRWLHAIDPQWAEAHFLAMADDQGQEGRALWDGILWSAHIPNRSLYLRLKPGLIHQAVLPRLRRQHGNIIAGFLLGGWGGEENAAEPERLVSDVEFRELLIDTDDSMRGQVIWYLQQWSNGDKGQWRDRVMIFFQHVWPKQRSLRTPAMSGHLADFILSSGDMMPQLVELVGPRLVSVRRDSLNSLLRYATGDRPPLDQPKAMLDTLWLILGEDASQWPYLVENVLDALAEAPETGADPRLAELRRRRQQ